MARPRHQHPTPAELQILQVLWDRGPCSVRDVLDAMRSEKNRAYTTVMSLMNTMADKGLLSRRPEGKAFIYTAAAPREQTLSQLLSDLMRRAFDGSAQALVAHLLDHTTPRELEEIRELIDAHKRKRGRS